MRDYRPSSKRGYSRDRDERRPSMHDAVCDECGRKCKVPFKPTGDKPIYCSECFEQKSGRSSYRSDRRDSGRRSFRDKRIYHAVCDECGKECEVPFRPTSGKPVFCDACFNGTGKKRSDKGADNRQIQEQIDVMNSKLDRIIQTLESLIVVEEEPKKKGSAKKTTSKKGKMKAKKPTKRKAKKTAKKKTKTKKTKTKKSTSKKK